MTEFRRWWGRLLGAALIAAPVAAQDSTHARQPPPTRRDTTAIARDTAPVVHVRVDSSPVDSQALDTVRRTGVRDSARAAAARDSVLTAIMCEGRRITAIDVRPQGPIIAVPRGHQTLALLARRLVDLHTTTRPGVIRRFLALRVGDVCVERRRAESERLLRAQPFIQSAQITAYADGPTGVRLDVFAVDELAGEIGLAVQARAPLVSQFRVSNANLFGEAFRATAEWARSPGYRDRFGGEIEDFQILGHPWVADARAQLDHVGGYIEGTLSHPYFTDLQRIGWRAAAGSNHSYFGFRRDIGSRPTLDLERDYANAGGLVRVGSPSSVDSVVGLGRLRYSELALVGLAVSHEGSAIGGGPVLLTGGGPVADTTSETAAAFAGRYARHHVARMNALFGLRAVRYLTVGGFDALLGTQDIPLGAQFAAVVGRSAAWLSGGAHDVFLSGRLDLATGTPSAIVRGGVQAEARRDTRNDHWDGVITSGRLAWYLKPSPRQTVILSADVAEGQRVRVPFQLALGDHDGGVRGYGGSNAAGNTRAVGQAEFRSLIRAPWRVLRAAASWGLAAFVDGGRVWAGDVPFGATTPWVAGAGVGLLVGVPPASHQLWRLDLAGPLVRRPGARFEFRVTALNIARLWWSEPRDVARSRDQSVTPSLFGYP